MSPRWDDYYPSYPKSTPLPAEGGIKASARRGSFARNWWAKRWIAVLESFDIGARLDRGKRYARSGQVLSIEVDRGMVVAEVQGSRKKPYAVVVTVKPLSQEQWASVGEHLAGQALFVAKLLAGEMPQDIETAFAEVGLSLFPDAADDLETRCSCPDWSNPCKHIAAVYYLLGEEFDRDPFLIFKLRGMEREGLVELFDAADAPADAGVIPITAAVAAAEAPALPEAAEAPEPLPTDPPEFWHAGALPDDLFGEVRIPDMPAALPRRLGNFPFWRGQAPLQGFLEAAYARASGVGMEVFVQESETQVTSARKGPRP